MTTQTQEIIEAVAPISDKLLQYITATEELLAKYGGDVADLALNVLRIDAAGNLLVGFALLGVLLTIALNIKKVAALERAATGNSAATVIFGIITLTTTGIFTTAKLFNIWNWVGLFWPEAYAVHKFILS